MNSFEKIEEYLLLIEPDGYKIICNDIRKELEKIKSLHEHSRRVIDKCREALREIHER